jgi:hypothetical protein
MTYWRKLEMDNFSDPNREISMIDTRGEVKWIRQSEVQQQKEKGWRVVSNPHQTYYPQYDTQLNAVVSDNDQIVESYDVADILEAEIL